MALPEKVKIVSGIVIGAVFVAGIYFLNCHESDAIRQSTDDAYVRADFTQVAPRISGQISRVLVNDDERSLMPSYKRSWQHLIAIRLA